VGASAIVLAALVAIAFVAFVAWAVYPLRPEKVFLRDGTLVKKHKGKVEEIRVSDISGIKYHYQAVVGFVAVWEFIGRGSKSVSVGSEAKGIDAVLGSLEKSLPGFSLAEFRRQFDEGDVEDSIDVWTA